MKMNYIFTMFCALVLIWSVGCDSESESKINNSSLSYPNARLLVSGNSLEKSLGDSNLVIIDARTNGGYSESHIPGAINMLFSDYKSGLVLKPTADIETQLGTAGISRDMKIVIYDNTSASFGAAGRIFWMLEYLGCSNVQILNGGWDKWVADGRTTETTVNTLAATTFTAEVNDDILSTKENIWNRIGMDNFAVIDARTDEEYIGWQFYGETRGGHIPGAVQIPYEWFYNTDKTVLSYEDLKTLFESRGITSDKEIAAYCTSGIRSGFVYFALRLLGYTNISNYDGSISDWAAADTNTYPMDKLTSYQMLVNADWVKTLIDGGNPGTAGTPATYTGNNYVIIEASSNRASDNTENYDTGHIPGAVYFNIYRLEPDWPNYPYDIWSEGNLADDAGLQDVIGNLGITSDTTVVIYYRSKGASQPFRVAWALLYAGMDINNVRILNGGYDAWVAYGGTVETSSNTPTSETFTITTPHPEYIATTEEVQAMRLDSGSALGDMRRWAEYIGEENNYIHIGFTALGRIPGAIWINEPSWYFDNDSTLRSFTEIQDMWEEAGITPDKNVATYCGTGWRSSLGFILGYLMDYPNIANYDSGFYGWSYDYNDPANPMYTGE